jgi:hypothetical protein
MKRVCGHPILVIEYLGNHWSDLDDLFGVCAKVLVLVLVSVLLGEVRKSNISATTGRILMIFWAFVLKI